MFGDTRRRRWFGVVPALLLVAGAGVFAAVAAAASPRSTAPPTIGGTAKEGSTLTAATGTWSNDPASFAYQWQRCASDGNACGDLNGADAKTYTPVSGDVSRTLRVVVTATNADGKASAISAPTAIVGSKNGPDNTVRPAVTGTPVVGEQLSVSNGSWSPTATSYVRQWQRCNADGGSCDNIDGATGRTYGVRSADAGHRLRALGPGPRFRGHGRLVVALRAVDRAGTLSRIAGRSLFHR